MIRIGILDNQDLFRYSITQLLNSSDSMKVSLDSSELSQIQEFLMYEQLDLLIIDTDEFAYEGLLKIKKLIHDFPFMKVMVLSDNLEKKRLVQLIEFGVSGFYTKKIAFDAFQTAIQEVVLNKNPFDVKLGPYIKGVLLRSDRVKGYVAPRNEISLSPRELEVLELVCQEKTNSEIADILHLSVRTVETHRSRMIEKMDCKNIIGVVMQAFQTKTQLNYNYSR